MSKCHSNEILQLEDGTCSHWSENIAYNDRLCPDGEYWKKGDELCAKKNEKPCIQYCSHCGKCVNTIDNEVPLTYEKHLLYKRALYNSALHRHRETNKKR